MRAARARMRESVYSSGGPCGRRSALLSRPPSRCPSAGFCAAARIEYCQRPSAARSSHRRNGWFHGRGHESRARQGVVGDHCDPQPRNWPVGTLLGRARRAGEGQIALAHRAHPYVCSASLKREALDRGREKNSGLLSPCAHKLWTALPESCPQPEVRELNRSLGPHEAPRGAVFAWRWPRPST